MGLNLVWSELRKVWEPEKPKINTIICDLQLSETLAIQKLKYSLQKSGYSITEEYQNNGLLILVFSKEPQKK